jgi:T-complex protein 1 subunit eta
MKLLDIAHPAAKVLVDISISQDAEVGDGTTSVVLLAGEILKNVKHFIEDGVHPQVSFPCSIYSLACKRAAPIIV